MTASSDAEHEEGGPVDHLEELADGCGCAEVWEYLSDRRDEE
jgi:hypothetical protein